MNKRTVLLICALLLGSSVMIGAAEQPIQIVKNSQNTYVQQTLKIEQLSGDKAFCEPFYRYLATCGWFRVVNGQADYTLSVRQSAGQVTMALSFGANPLFSKNITYRGDIRRAAARSVDELIQSRFRKRLCDSVLVFTAETRPGIKEVFICDTDGGNLRKVTNYSTSCVEPSWMPDGKSVVYTRYTPSGTDICETMIKPWQSRRLTRFPGMNVGAAVHPTGKFLAMVMSIDRQVELYVKAIDSRDRRRLTNSRAVEASPCWHPDGSMVCYVSDRSGRPGIYMINANGGKAQKLPTIGSEAVTPCWSNDGKLAYAARINGSYKIAIYNPNGSDSGVIPNLPAGDWEAPAWAPDSRHLAATLRIGKKSEIYIIDSKTGNARKLLNFNYSQSSPDWSPIRRD